VTKRPDRAGALLALGLWALFAACAHAPPGAAPPAPPAAAATPAPLPTVALPPPEGELFRVPLGDGPLRGGRAPKVTIVEFSDFECPFCARVSPTLDKLLAQYGEDLALAFRHNPLPFHPHARAAAQAAEAARAQGKFWEMHDRLFADPQHLARADLDARARALGLDMTKFAAALDGDADKARIERDIAEAERFGANGTPSFFINGRPVVGAQPFETFQAVVDDAIKRADAALAAGVPRAQLYAALTKDGVDKAPERKPEAAAEPSDADVRYRVDVAGAPARGARSPLVTMVEFSDFQCPFCARVQPVLSKLLAEYPDDLRLVWRDEPLSFHEQAQPAARAGRAAAAQGKFWEMHDKLFADQKHLGRSDFLRYAADLGLDAKAFSAVFDADSTRRAVEADAAAGRKIGARGTPTFFINGKVLLGAQPIEAFRAKIEEELKRAREMVAAGTARGEIYAALMKDAVARKPGAATSPEDDDTVYPVDPGDAPSKGPEGAPLTVVVFSDFQCPFCKRVEPTLARLMSEYPGQVRLVWKNFPLPFHANARPAAMAAMAAHGQGKFWEMHDQLFTHNEDLDRPHLERYAAALRLDMKKFRADLDAGTYEGRIAADMSQGEALGVRGTPVVFINGRKIAGAYPWEVFKAIADAELAKAQVKAGRPGAPPGK
jgi:protein-disulfide isomerase